MSDWILDRLPRVLPASWRVHERRDDGCMYVQAVTGLSLIVSGETHDGRDWIHMSVAHRDRLPTWNEMVDIKEMFVGRDVNALQVIPARDKYVNINPHCLHFFTPASGDWPLPDFTRGSGNL